MAQEDKAQNKHKYALDLPKHKKIFEDEIVRDRCPKLDKEEIQQPIESDRDPRPKAIIIAGQPGSGKGGLTGVARKEFEGEGHVEIDTDELRGYHPKYPELQKEDLRTAAGHVQKDAGEWADDLREKAMSERRNLIIDGTLKSPDSALRMCQELKDAGYEVEIRVMAVRDDVSKQGIYGRYEDAYADYMNGVEGAQPPRWVPEYLHDEAYGGVVESLEEIDKAQVADRVSVYRRDPMGRTPEGERLPPQEVSTTDYRKHGEKQTKPQDEVGSERSRRRSPQEQEAYDKECSRICDLIEKRDPTLSEPENQRAFELAGRKIKQPGEQMAAGPHELGQDGGPKSAQDGEAGGGAMETEVKSRHEQKGVKSPTPIVEWDRQEGLKADESARPSQLDATDRGAETLKQGEPDVDDLEPWTEMPDGTGNRDGTGNPGGTATR